MKNNLWFNNNPKCVIFCAGKGTRLFPITLERQKTMIDINSKPILGYIIDYWKKFTNNFIFVVKYKKEGVLNYLRTRQDINYEIQEESEIKGIADGLWEVQKYINDNFIVVLGDCFCRGNFKFPKNFEQGVGVWRAEFDDDIKRSYSIEIDGNKIIKVVEKPQKLINRNCGMGFYFFNPKVFDYIKKTPQDKKGYRGITEVIQLMIEGGEEIKPLYFEGDYLNVTYQEDLERLERLLKQ